MYSDWSRTRPADAIAEPTVTLQPGTLLVGIATVLALGIGPALTASTGTPLPAALATGLALLFAPGWLLIRAACGAAPASANPTTPGLRVHSASIAAASPAAPAAYFVASQLVLTIVMAATLLAGASLGGALTLLVAVVVVLTVTAARRPQDRPTANPGSEESRTEQLLWAAVLGMTALLLAAAAYRFTASASIDRWWYLAYVRSYLDAAAIGTAEPFLGTGLTHPRFSFQPWLMTLALWARQSAIDPIRLYETVAAPLLAPVALSAQWTLARAIFSDGASARLVNTATIMAGLLMLSAGPIPVAARIPEDKILAAAIGSPMLFAAAIRAAREHGTGSLIITGALAVMLAIIHPLVLGLTLLVLIPWLALEMAGRDITPRRAVTLLCSLATGAALAAVIGAPAASALERSGARLSNPEHPVVRVHLARERLVVSQAAAARTSHHGGGRSETDARTPREIRYRVSASLLRHPLVFLALAAAFLGLRRPPRERRFVLTATLVPLSVAFVPAAAGLLGSVVLPWMVYRVLWMIPFGPLLAIGAATIARDRPAALGVVLAVTTSIAAAPALESLDSRQRPERAARALPRSAQPGAESRIDRIRRAIRDLPDTSLIAAAPELAERLPALTGLPVLAMSDRATVVFSPTIDEAQSRLLASAAALAGVRLAPGAGGRIADAAPRPTHVVLPADEAAAGSSRTCGTVVAGSPADGFIICETGDRGPVWPPLHIAAADQPGAFRASLDGAGEDQPGGDGSAAVLSCDPEPQRLDARLVWARPGPWSPTPAAADCSLRSPGRRVRPRTLSLSVILGRAADRLLVTAAGSHNGTVAWREAVSSELRNDDRLTLRLPTGTVDRIDFHIAPSYLPFLKLSDLTVTYDVENDRENGGQDEAEDDSEESDR